MMPPGRTRYARDKKARIDQVVEISQEIIENQGYESLTMNLIHKRTRIPVGTLYKDFPDGKADILLEIARRFGDDFAAVGTPVDEGVLRNYVFHALDVGRSRRKILIAIQMETLNDPDGILRKTRDMAPEYDITSFEKIVQYVVGHPLSTKQVFEMLGVWKAVVRQHIIFRNLYGSDEEFLSMITKIIKGMGA
ncbi:MAG: TetR/AcrR family transcriptional regulator [Candidatus Lokiarchaeota archaeon]|nr:TetR/AcrR family transcriptional regulator [Candidatus Lokiarchaeota archaeon]